MWIRLPELPAVVAEDNSQLLKKLADLGRLHGGQEQNFSSQQAKFVSIKINLPEETIIVLQKLQSFKQAFGDLADYSGLDAEKGPLSPTEQKTSSIFVNPAPIKGWLLLLLDFGPAKRLTNSYAYWA